MTSLQIVQEQALQTLRNDTMTTTENRDRHLIIATGCPSSGWERVLPVLDQMGLTPVNNDFNRWHDQYFQSRGQVSPLPPAIPGISPLAIDEYGHHVIAEAVPRSIFMADSRSVWLLDFWHEKYPDALFLLFYTRPETAVTHALRQGVDPNVFLHTWQTANRQLMQFQRRHRKNAVLFDAEAAMIQPQAFSGMCRRHGLSLQEVEVEPVEIAETASEEFFLARYFLQQQAGVQSLQAELTAGAQPLEPPTLPQVSLSSFGAVIKRLARERELAEQLDDTVQQLTREKEKQVRFNNEQKQQIDDLNAKLKQQEDLKQQLENSARENKEENELLLLQLHQVQEELETVFLKKQELEQGHQKLQDENIGFKKQQQQLTREKEKQVRFNNEQKQQINDLNAKLKQQEDLKQQLKTAQESRQQLENTVKETTEENELLLLQLHQVQEELESIFLQKQQIEAERAQTEASLKKQRQRADRLKQTVSWKITAPLRGMTRPFRKTDKKKRQLQKQIHLIKSSGLFDEQWYLAQYPDVAQNGVDPIRHYLQNGATEDRNPSPTFHTQMYRESHPEVMQSGENPLVHYIRQGNAPKNTFGQ
jgi:hypothetical protein